MSSSPLSIDDDLKPFFENRKVTQTLHHEQRIRDLEQEVLSLRNERDRQATITALSLDQLEEENASLRDRVALETKRALIATMSLDQLEEEQQQQQRQEQQQQQQQQQQLTPPPPPRPQPLARTSVRHVRVMRECLRAIFGHCAGFVEVNENDPDTLHTGECISALRASLDKDALSYNATEEADSIETCSVIFDQLFPWLKESVLKNAELTEKLNHVTARYKEAYAHNERLVTDHRLMVEHTKESDALFNDAANALDERTAQYDRLKAEHESMIREMEEAERLFGVLQTRLEWKTQADNQGYTEDAKKLTKLVAGLRLEKQTFQTDALQNKRTANGLSIKVKALRDELAKLRREVIQARAKIPHPYALIEAREINEHVDMEIAESRLDMINDEEACIDPDRCRRCAVIWLAKKHAETELRTLELKVTEVQHSYHQYTLKKDEETERRIREGLRDVEIERQGHGSRERKRCDELAAMKKALDTSEAFLAELRTAHENRAQTRALELERAKETMLSELTEQALERDGDMLNCGRSAIHIVTQLAAAAQQQQHDGSGVLGRFADAADVVNHAMLTDPTRVAQSYRLMLRVMCEMCPDGTSTELMRAILNARTNNTTAPETTTTTTSAPLTEIETRSHDLLVSIVQPLAMLCNSVSSVEEWRESPELSRRCGSVTDAVNMFLGLPGVDFVDMLSEALFVPYNDVPFIEWVIHQAVGCMGTNDYFANAMRKGLDSARRVRDDAVKCNQALVVQFEDRIKQLVSLSQPSPRNNTALHVLLRQDGAMMKALTEAVNGATGPISEAMASPDLPLHLKAAINSLQLAWGFVRRLCEDSAAATPTTTTANGKRARLSTSDGAATSDYCASPTYTPGSSINA